MKLRARLALAFLLLAVLPLAGVSIYSYVSSLRAFRHAVERETAVATDEMGVRMERLAAELGRRIQALRERHRESWSPAFTSARREALEAARHEQEAAIMKGILAGTDDVADEIPFAVSANGEVTAADTAQAARLAPLGLGDAAARGETRLERAGWLIVLRREPGSDMTLGIARPLGESLDDIRNTAVRNLGYGLALVAVALLGIFPLASRMTRDLDHLAEGAERLGSGDMKARVPVRSGDEFGRLAGTFNRMAEELEALQKRAVEQARMRRELEMCRLIQEDLLPRGPLVLPFAEVRGSSIPAREVGGDFFNYFSLGDSRVALLVGDVSGKGIAAALLMANLQATLRARLALGEDLARLARQLDDELFATTPPQTYLTLFMAVYEAGSRQLHWVNAGHNPPFVITPSGTATLSATGRPLGLVPGGGYEQVVTPMGPGDCAFLYTDGLVEAEDATGTEVGIDGLQRLVERQNGGGLEQMMSAVETAVRNHRGDAEPADDATMVVLRTARQTAAPPAVA